MRKYLWVFLLTIQETFTYRLNFVLWRFRNIISLVALIIFWQAVYGTQSQFLGYEKTQMLTYLVGVALLKAIVLGSKSADLAGQIRSGELNRLLLRPWQVFRYYLFRDFADKTINLIFSLVEIIVIAIIFNITVYFPVNLSLIPIVILSLVLAILLYFFVSLCLSVTAFWTEDIWAAHWLFGVVLLEFMAGIYFPIDILPSWLTRFINLTPFPYLIYFPLKLWNGQVVGFDVVRVLVIQIIWLVFFAYLYRRLWQVGTKKFGAYGG